MYVMPAKDGAVEPAKDVVPVVASQFNLKPGSSVRVEGDILPDARKFGIDLGTDEDNVALHFNPRFDIDGFKDIIIFNTKTSGQYGIEYRDRHFPFSLGSRTEIFIDFEGQSFVVKLPDGYRMTFPNRLDTTIINYVAVFGDIITRVFAFE
ncbi:galectin-1-like [Petaurus breviceps papuanus]|uniref:galectin-1-like n=1 Tax=Petaurus breviceps papuanus TaxID=3040969 RepID=UPI0036D8F42A